MCKRKKSSTTVEPPLTPPPSTTVDQPSLEPVDPAIIQAIIRAIAPLKSGEHEKALNFIKDSISCYPLSGQLHYTEGRIHWSLANNAAEDDEAKVKHLKDGIRSAQLAVDRLPNSLHCTRLLVDLVYQLAFFDQEWDRVIEACKHGLKIENSTDYGIKELFGEDVSDESGIEVEKQTIMMWLRDAEQKNLEFTARKAIEVVNKKDKEKEDCEVDINHEVMATDRRKKQLKAVTKKLKDNNEDISIYKQFWSITLSDEKKRGFRKVNIEELVSHFKSLKDQLSVDLLWEAIGFAKHHKTWKFWECFDCVKKFGDCKLYSNHFWEVHWVGNQIISTLDGENLEESMDMVLNGVWKPVDTGEVIKFIVNPIKTEKALDECKIFSVEEVPGKNSKDNESSKISMHGPKWEICDDIERSEILERIRSIFGLLSENNCLAPVHFHWAIEFTMDQLESEIPLSQFRNLGLETLQSICFLDASKLTEVLTFLEDVAHTCGLSDNVEIDNKKDDKLSGHHVVDIKERVLFSRDLSCLLLQEQVLQRVANYLDAVADDGSAVSFSADDCEDDVLPDRDDIVSWLHMGSNCGEGLVSWTSLRESQRSQAMKSHGVYLEKLSVLPNIGARNAEIASKLTAIQTVASMFLQEIEKREKNPEYEPQLYMDLLKKRQKQLQVIQDISERSELDVISEVLEKAEEVPSRDQSGFEECSVEDELRMHKCMKQRDNCIKLALRRLKMQLLKDLSFHDTIILRKINALKQYELELTNITVCDYRSTVVPMLKSFLQARLKDLYEDAKEKSKAAEEALLAQVTLESEKKISKGFDNEKQKQDKKKKKKKKNKNAGKTKESKETDDNKHFKLHQKDAEQNDNPNSKNNDSLDEPQQLIASDEERRLSEYIENQRQFEHEASLKVNASASRPENEAADCGE
ncbi:hypothetical protein ACOSQ3_029580 [Xanthoceras sorbifolium]